MPATGCDGPPGWVAGAAGHSRARPTLPLREALRAGRGLCIVVLRARIDGGDGVLRVRVVENAFAAHPRHDALSLAEVVSRALHGWNPSLPGFETPFSIDGEDAWDIPEEPDARGRYRVGMRFTARASADLPRPATAAS